MCFPFYLLQLVHATQLVLTTVSPVMAVPVSRVRPPHFVTSAHQDTGVLVLMAADLATVQATVIPTLETA